MLVAGQLYHVQSESSAQRVHQSFHLLTTLGDVRSHAGVAVRLGVVLERRPFAERTGDAAHDRRVEVETARRQLAAIT